MRAAWAPRKWFILLAIKKLLTYTKSVDITLRINCVGQKLISVSKKLRKIIQYEKTRVRSI